MGYILGISNAVTLQVNVCKNFTPELQIILYFQLTLKKHPCSLLRTKCGINPYLDPRVSVSVSSSSKMSIGCFDAVKKHQGAKQSMGGGWIPTAACVSSKPGPQEEVSPSV